MPRLKLRKRIASGIRIHNQRNLPVWRHAPTNNPYQKGRAEAVPGTSDVPNTGCSRRAIR